MQTNLRPYSLFIAGPNGVVPNPPSSDQIVQALESVAGTAGLDKNGLLALSQWVAWLAYNTIVADSDPHLNELPGWNTVLPLHWRSGQNTLRRLLLRAGTSTPIVDRAIKELYGNSGLPTWPIVATDASALKEKERKKECVPAITLHQDACRACLLNGPGNELPSKVTAFDALPSWAREIALLAGDLVGKKLGCIPGLSGLDLRYLYAPYADFAGCDLRDCNLSHGDLRGAKFDNANTGNAIIDTDDIALHNARRNRCFPPRPCSDGRNNFPFPDFLADKDIVNVAPLTRRTLVEGVSVGFIESGRSVIQQHAIRGCTAASAAMLIHDHSADFDPTALTFRDLGNDEDIRRDIETAGLIAVQTTVESLQTLAAQLEAVGPAAVSVTDREIGGHSIVLDRVDLTEREVQMRDPYHGWAVSVRLAAATAIMRFPMTIVQAKKRAPGPEMRAADKHAAARPALLHSA